MQIAARIAYEINDADYPNSLIAHRPGCFTFVRCKALGVIATEDFFCTALGRGGQARFPSILGAPIDASIPSGVNPLRRLLVEILRRCLRDFPACISQSSSAAN